MKRFMLSCAVIGAAMLFAGCSTVESASADKLSGQSLTPQGNSVAHITATTEGLYFFCFPLIVGSAEKPGNIVFCEDSCNTKAVTKMLTRKSQQIGGTRTIGVVSMKDSMFLPFLLSWKSATASGNAIR